MVPFRRRWSAILLSLLIVTVGLVAAGTLQYIDQDLRSIYAEYTLAATELGHVYGQLTRYRTTVLRAIESDTQEEFQRIARSLPAKRVRIHEEIEDVLRLMDKAPHIEGLTQRNVDDFKAVWQELDRYMSSSDQTMHMLARRWQSAPIEAERIREEAERHTARESGDRFNALMAQLDDVVRVLVDVASQVRKDADIKLRVATGFVIGVTFVIAGLVLRNPWDPTTLSHTISADPPSALSSRT
ncbi:MAG TPA: MCP four helix bundle domain-containing protein [Nitrospira sp.]|nr:MCP four helix bundle domain-containing protein [Nitrospira sp.]